MPPPGPPKSRRCYFFDSRGHRLALHGEYGCSRSSATCHFVHPSDPEWESVVLAETNKRFSEDQPSPASPTRGRRRSPSFDRQRSPGRPPRGSLRIRSPVRRHASSRSPRRDDHPPPHYHDRDIPRRSSSHERPKRLDLDRIPHSSKPPPRLAMSTNPREEAKPSPVRGTAATTPSVLPTPAMSKPSSETPSKPMAVPSHRRFSEVLPPPPTQTSSLPSDDAMTPEHRRAVWEKRIALMADATKEFMELEKLKQDVQTRRDHVQMSTFAALPSEIRTTFQASLANGESAYEKKRDSYNNVINKLSETDFWPAVPSQRVGEMEAKLKEAKTMLGGLADGVGQLYKKIEGLYEQRLGGPSAKQSGSNEGVMASGSGDGAVHTKKRRRLSTDGSDEATSDIREDVESIKNTVREIEDHLREVENDITQHSCHVMEQLESKIEEKIEEIALNSDLSSMAEVRLGPQTAKSIQAFSESFALADREMGELAQEVAELLPKLDSLKRDNDLFKQEEAATKELLAELVKADQENAEALARLQSEAEVLQKGVAAHATRAIRPSLPPLPTLPLSKPFMDVIEESIQKQVHQQIVPIFAEARIGAERIAQARDMELYEKLVGYKTDQTSSKLTQLISAWIVRHPEYVHQALTAAAKSGAAGPSHASS